MPAPADVKAGLFLVVDAEPGVTTLASGQLLSQALGNLIDNAIKFAPSGSTIEVSAQRKVGHVEVRIADRGPGIPSAERERVFQRFTRLDQARGTPGSGLGLSLVAAVARLHSARLTLSDNAPGLVVTLELPTVAPAVPAVSAP